MKAHLALYIAWAATILGIGILDILIAFEPILTFLVTVLFGAAFFCRHIIKTYIPFIEFQRSFVMVTLCMLAINGIVGLSLNPTVDRKAQSLVSRVEIYKKEHGEFPRSLVSIADEPDFYQLKTNRLIFGAHVAYESDGRAFWISYTRYLISDSMWNQVEHKFQPALD